MSKRPSASAAASASRKKKAKPEAKEALFYCCPVLKCNAKYKTQKGLVNHSLVVHNQMLEDDEILPPRPKATATVAQKDRDVTAIQRAAMAKRRAELEEKARGLAEDVFVQQAFQQALAKLEQSLPPCEVFPIHPPLPDNPPPPVHSFAPMTPLMPVKPVAPLAPLATLASAIIEKAAEPEVVCGSVGGPECAICLDEMAPGSVGVVMPCGHAKFCYKCILAVEVASGPCPICRDPIICVSKLFT